MSSQRPLWPDASDSGADASEAAVAKLKSAARALVRQNLQAWLIATREDRIRQHLGLQEQLLSTQEFKSRDTWAAFVARPGEPDLAPFLFELKRRYPELSVAFPKVSGEGLEFYVPRTEQDFSRSAWGISEPVPACSKHVRPEDISGFLVPGVAFDRSGRRLGSGKGFYDRILSRSRGKKLGVAYSVQLLSQPLPHNELDVPMDLLVSENEIHRIELGTPQASTPVSVKDKQR
jgi:5-formyltetrahydrofolate cyclo-ligase